MKDSRLDGILNGMGTKPIVPLTAKQVEEEPDGEELTIAQMDGDYSKMRPSNRGLTRIHIIHIDGNVDTLYYHHLDAKSKFSGGSFTFVFSGAKMWELTVEGRQLWRIYDYISLSRWPYIRVATRDFEANGEVVTAVTIKDITPKETG